MDRKEDLRMREKGYIPIEEHVARNIAENCKVIDEDGFQRLLEAIRLYEEASARFHQPGGDGYYIVQRCLQKYRDCKFIQKHRAFRFDVPAASERVMEEEYEYVPRKRTQRPLNGSQADIYYLLFEADQSCMASRRCKDYVSSNKLHLTAVLTNLIEQAVAFMEEDDSKRVRAFGRILKTAYMDPLFADMDAGEIYTRLGYSKKQYYTLRSQAITLMSEFVFGFFAGEKGMAELYINRDEIVIPSLKR